MKKQLLGLFVLLLFMSPSTIFASGNVKIIGEIEMEGDHPTLSDGEVSETEWREGRPGGTDGSGSEEPGSPDSDGGLVDWLADLWDDAVDAGEKVWDSLKDGAKVTWDTIAGGAEASWDFIKNVGVSISDWYNDLPDWGQDLIKTIGAVIIGAAIVIGVIVGGAALLGITIAVGSVIAGAIAGAVLLGGGYFALNGGTDDFSFSHALMWATGGGFLGGFAFTSAGSAVVTALARRLAPTFAQKLYLIFQLGGRGMAARFLLGTWLRKSVVPMSGLIIFEGLNIFMTGELPSARNFASNTILTLLTAPIGGHFTNKAISSFGNKKIVNGVLSASAGMNIGGASSYLLESAGSGSGSWIDYVVGMATAGLFMRLRPTVNKYMTDKTREIGYEVLQKSTGGQLSNILKGKPNIINGFQEPTNTKYYRKTPKSFNLNGSVDPNLSYDSLQNKNKLTQQEQKALQDYLQSVGEK
ncbi:hypothetical protein FH966_10460 [Lentibacillus cibarius]|uniref:Uncharacterized protein n=1 Tax=Lentibacillus cibarius TaxID=2583219 RepID=A0A549YJL2_9BACI|nr:hypothetical protein [Lentibacillus cibarius]TRM12070.1 hypothetical protein FH966_10460 [Lentibacillus cibarius]